MPIGVAVLGAARLKREQQWQHSGNILFQFHQDAVGVV